jgi:hypothetical protein
VCKSLSAGLRRAVTGSFLRERDAGHGAVPSYGPPLQVIGHLPKRIFKSAAGQEGLLDALQLSAHDFARAMTEAMAVAHLAGEAALIDELGQENAEAAAAIRRRREER